MTTLIVNSNRLDLIDEIHAQNKSIIIDADKHELLFNDGTGTYSTKDGASEDPRVGDLANLTTTDKSSIVNAINEVEGNTQTNADQIESIHDEVTSLAEDLSKIKAYEGYVSSIAQASWTSDAQAPAASYGYKAVITQ